MIKVKPYEDVEAKLLSKKEIKLKRGTRKQFEMQMENGGIFLLKSGLNYMNFDAQIGSIFTVKCSGINSKGLPIRPSFFRIKK